MPVSIQDIKEQVSMEDLLGHLGADFPNWRSRGDWASVSCPLHEDAPSGRSYKDGRGNQHPSGRYTDSLENDDGNTISKFWCPVCEFSGDQFDLVIAAGKAKDFHLAVAWLCKEFNLGGYAPGERHAKDKPRELPYPEEWGKPSSWLDQERWAQMLTRWMPVARHAMSPRDGRSSLAKIFRLVDPDKVDQELREIIFDAIHRYDSTRGAFTTILQLEVRSRVRDATRNEIRRRIRDGLPLGDRADLLRDPRGTTSRGGVGQLRDVEGSPVSSLEAEWARRLDWSYALDAAAMELGDVYAGYALLRGEGFSQTDIAEVIGISRKRVRKIEREFRDWYRDVRGHEATVYKEAAEAISEEARSEA